MDSLHTSHWTSLRGLFLSWRYILDYLRDGELLCPDDKTVRKKLLREAKFFQVQGIITLLDEENCPLRSSVIIKNENHHSTVMSWLHPKVIRCLLYRATTDGKSPVDFHHCCDNTGSTLVVMKSGGFIFGGYTTKSWQSRKYSICFLYRLVSTIHLGLATRWCGIKLWV